MPIASRRVFLDEVTKRVEAGKMRSVIDRCFPLERLADAYRHAERGSHRGNGRRQHRTEWVTDVVDACSSGTSGFKVSTAEFF